MVLTRSPGMRVQEGLPTSNVRDLAEAKSDIRRQVAEVRRVAAARARALEQVPALKREREREGEGGRESAEREGGREGARGREEERDVYQVYHSRESCQRFKS